MIMLSGDQFTISTHKLPERRFRHNPPSGDLETKVLPLTGYEGTNNVRTIFSNSRLSERRAVWHMARYFKREFGYDFVQYGDDGFEHDDNHVAYLWESGFDPVAIGACCFRWRHENKDDRHWGLQWVWFHPYVRRRGMLTAIWPFFRHVFDDFRVEYPLSTAMEVFLRKIDPDKLPWNQEKK